MLIRPSTLKHLREHRNLSQADLERETLAKGKVSVGTIKRIESSHCDYKARPTIAKNLATALGVDPEDLAKSPKRPKKRKKSSQGKETNTLLGRQQLKVSIKNETASSLQMVESLYGIPIQDQINMAPLFVALLAEASLKWRKEKLDQIHIAVDEISQLSKGHLSFANLIDRVSEAAFGEEHSINSRDVFGRNVSDDAFVGGYEPGTHNPFANFLREFAINAKSKHIKLDIHDDLEIGPDGIPEYTIGKEMFEQISGGDPLAEFSLQRGHAKIHNIPKNFLPEEMREERVAWIIEKIPSAARRKYEAQQAKFNAIFAGLDLALDQINLAKPEDKKE